MVDRLNTNQDLAVAGPLASPDGSSKLVLQADGNVVLYRSTGTARWASGTSNAVSAVMQGDGNFVLLSAAGTPIWATGPTGPASNAYFLVVQDDGNLVIYGPNGPIWASNTVVLRSMVPGFLPSSSGFRFPNTFPAVPDYVINVAGRKIPIGDASNGLCGGMVFAVRDYFDAGLPIPPDVPLTSSATGLSTGPSSGPLFDYLVKRLLDSFNLGLIAPPPPPVPPLPGTLIAPLPPWGPGPLTYWFLMDPALPDHETVASQVGLAYHGKAWVMINDSWPKIKSDIDTHLLSPVALIEVRNTDPTLMGNNHQVLCYGYSLDGSDLTLRLYDPNDQQNDNVWMSLSIADPNHTVDVAYNDPSRTATKIWCFFRPIYTFSSPPVLSGQMWHTIRNPNGSWQPAYGLIESQETNDPGPFSAVACASVQNSLHVAGLSADGKMWHTIRNADGTWQPTYGLIESQETNDPGPFGAVACAGVLDALHVVGLSKDRRMWHTIRKSDGTWQPTYGLINSQETNNPGPFTAIACAGIGDSLHVVGLANSQMWHTIRHPDGSWQPTYGLIESQEKNDPGPFGAIACAGVGNSLHVVGLSADGTLSSNGKMWHTIRNPDGTWQPTYGLIESQETNDPGPFSAIACASVGNLRHVAGLGSSLHVAGLSADGKMWHTIRNPDGSWQPAYGLIEGQETNDPGPFGAIACAGVVNALHVVGRH